MTAVLSTTYLDEALGWFGNLRDLIIACIFRRLKSIHKLLSNIRKENRQSEVRQEILNDEDPGSGDNSMHTNILIWLNKNDKTVKKY